MGYLHPELSRRVVITGMGAVTPLGNNVAEFWQNLLAGRSGIVRVDFPHTSIKVGAPVKDFDLTGVVFPHRIKMDRMAPVVLYALKATHEALSQAHLLKDDGTIFPGLNEKQVSNERKRIGVYIGTGIGGGIHLGELALKLKKGEKISVKENLQITPDRLASVPAMLWGLKGQSSTVSQACASGLLAINLATEKILLGKADLMLAGGAETPVHDLLLSIYEPTTALTRETDPQKASRPFDKQRSGFVAGDGAGVIVLEEMYHALDRGVTPLCEIVGYSSNTDGEYGHDTDPTGDGQQRAIQEAVEQVIYRFDSDQVHVNAHATGTRFDSFEASNIREGLIEAGLPKSSEIVVSANKGAIGHLFGGAAGPEVIATVMTLKTGLIPPTLGLEEKVEEAKDLTIPTGKPYQAVIGLAVKESFGFGGYNTTLAAVKFDKYERLGSRLRRSYYRLK